MVRIKYRYLLVHILYPEPDSKSRTVYAGPAKPLPNLVQFHRPSPDDLTSQLLARSIKDQIALLYGDYGVGLTSNGLNGTVTGIGNSLFTLTKPSATVKYLSPATSTAIVRCARAHFRLVWAALSFMTELPKISKQASSRPCVMQVVRVSGTIKKVEEEAIRRARIAVLKAKRAAGEGATDALSAILGQPDQEPQLGKEASLLAGFENDDDDDLEMDSDSGG